MPSSLALSAPWRGEHSAHDHEDFDERLRKLVFPDSKFVYRPYQHTVFHCFDCLVSLSLRQIGERRASKLGFLPWAKRHRVPLGNLPFQTNGSRGAQTSTVHETSQCGRLGSQRSHAVLHFARARWQRVLVTAVGGSVGVLFGV